MVVQAEVEHLRKGEQRVMQRFAAILAAHDGVARAATKTSGRPRAFARPRPSTAV